VLSHVFSTSYLVDDEEVNQGHEGDEWAEHDGNFEKSRRVLDGVSKSQHWCNRRLTVELMS
jgi:hypothetical protein